MIRIGLTGNIGSGKSVVSKIFGILGVPVFNADQQGGFVLEMPEVIKDITSEFGFSILDAHGNIDRNELAKIVFADKIKLEVLNSIIHPRVISEFEKWAWRHMDAKCILMESAILFETNYSEIFDKIVLVCSPERLRLKRVMERDRTDAKHVKSRMKQQLPEKDKIERSDFVIRNSDNKPLIPQVLSVYKQLISATG